MRGLHRLFIVGLLLTGDISSVFAVKIGDLKDVHWQDQMVRFFQFYDPTVRITVVGSILLGLCCGVLGLFMVVRRRALLGDTLSHAVLPGVALGFLWTMSKAPWVLFVGATIAGIIGVFVVGVLKKSTLLKDDSCMGLVLSGFYGIGIFILTMIQNIPATRQSGLDEFLFGQIAALGQADIVMMGIVTLISLVLVVALYKEFVITSFDSVFAQTIGLPEKVVNALLMLLLAFTIVISLKAVGVVLVSAMLIIPAATALLLSRTLHRALIISAIFGILAGVSGSFLSFIAHNLPTGPFMVVSAATLFLFAFFFAPRYGFITRWWQARDHSIH